MKDILAGICDAGLLVDLTSIDALEPTLSDLVRPVPELFSPFVSATLGSPVRRWTVQHSASEKYATDGGAGFTRTPRSFPALHHRQSLAPSTP